MVRIGLDNLYYALLTEDNINGTLTYQTPVRVTGAISATLTTNAATETLFADDGPFDTASTLGQLQLELNTADIDLETQSVWLGHNKTGAILNRQANAVPPWMAIGFRSLKSNGGYRYVWFYKGKAQEPDRSYETKTDAVNFQTPTITITFVDTEANSYWERSSDSDDPNYTPDIGTNWFTSPTGTIDTTAPTATYSPTDGATGVAVDTNVVVTFNEAIQATTATSSNIVLLQGATPVPTTLTINADRTIVTLDPVSDLTATTLYTVLVTSGVRNLAGIAFVTETIQFTTA